MPDKDPNWLVQVLSGNSDWLVRVMPIALASCLAAVGGAVQYLNQIDKLGLKFNILKFLLEIFTSGFVGVVSFMLCDSAGFGWELTAAVVAISGHMGARAILLIETQLVRRYESEYNCKRETETKEASTNKAPH